jgi:hypothetical protein
MKENEMNSPIAKRVAEAILEDVGLKSVLGN